MHESRLEAAPTAGFVPTGLLASGERFPELPEGGK